MSTPVCLFDYELPPELIAQHSVEPRDHSRLMVMDRQSGQWQNKRFYNLLEELHAGDVLVMNNTKVFRARLEAFVESASWRAGQRPREQSIELFLLRPRDGAWETLVKPGRCVHIGDTIRVGELEGSVLGKGETVLVTFSRSEKFVLDYANRHGQIPVPPYVHKAPQRLEDYQTLYARETGSVAAPTAGFHFTQELLEKIRAKGVEIREVTLHVGLGTFRPMKRVTIEEHHMHSEFVAIDSHTSQAINRAKQEGRRVIAVGTTTVRTLEGIAATGRIPSPEMYTNFLTYEKRYSPPVLPLEGFSGDINLFITPGFDFKVVDALITNFHLPKSTLLVLVSAFAGREHILAAYRAAIEQRYRFFSFGDAMFIR